MLQSFITDPTMSGTQIATNSSPAEKSAMTDCVATIDQLSKTGPSGRQRLKKIIKSVLLDRPDSETRPKKPSTSSAADEESTPAGAQSTPKAEDAPQRQPGSSDDGEINLTAANLWNRLFKSKDYVKLVGNREFFHKKLMKLLSHEATLRISKGLELDVMNLKVEFLKSKEINTDKLKLSLQEQFTKIVIRQIGTELARSKAETTAKLEYLAGLDDQALKKQAEVREKSSETNKQVTEAEGRINELARVVNEHLVKIRNENSDVGSPRHTLGLLEKSLNQSVINLPKIIVGVRTHDEESIYRSEYNQLPPEVKECFDYSVALIEMASEAVAAEKRAIAEYKLIHDKINAENQIGKQITDLEEKITLIEEAEAIAGKIVEAQTFWKYEGVPAPGDDEKTPMNASTSQKR